MANVKQYKVSQFQIENIDEFYRLKIHHDFIEVDNMDETEMREFIQNYKSLLNNIIIKYNSFKVV